MNITREFKELIRNSSGEAFYAAIEQYLSSHFNLNHSSSVPVHLKKVLMLNDCDSALILSKFNKDTLYELEQFMKDKFTSHLISREDRMNEYLGIFTNCQSSFQFLAGEKIMLRMIVKICKSVMNDVQTSAEAENDDQVELSESQQEINLEETDNDEDNEEEVDLEETDSE